MNTLYGIKNCDTVKKARKWLEEHDVDYKFHDLRVDGLTIEMIEHWFIAAGWQTLVNKRSTTWRQLDKDQKAGLNEQSAAKLLLANPTLIKRPVLNNGHDILVGFSEDSYLQNNK